MLTNPIRRYFGIKEIDKNWKKLDIKNSWRNDYVLIDDNNVIQKLIQPLPEDEFYYKEADYEVPLEYERGS